MNNLSIAAIFFIAIFFTFFDQIQLDGAILKAIMNFIDYARRGFSDRITIKFIVNEQIKLSGETIYFITKNEYMGKSKKPSKILYYCKDKNAICSHKPNRVIETAFVSQTSVDFYDRRYSIIEYDNFNDAMNQCIEHRLREDKRVQSFLNKMENERMQEVVTVNHYEF